ncbi:MAG TPA: tetratricopeptide repeat protein [Pyrinomonadaceae bacterium]|nr:tetratricopeptide repeat protein [Pyrinomonadaceae bacterium]
MVSAGGRTVLALAQSNLGVLYRDGRGVPRNEEEVVKLFRLAAGQGLSEGQYNLGVSYDEARGVTRNYAEAVKWYQLAAAQGMAQAQYNLAASYANGQGVATNYVQSYVWLTLAGRSLELARRMRSLVAQRMTTTQVAEAERQAVNWQPKKAIAAENLQGVVLPGDK